MSSALSPPHSDPAKYLSGLLLSLSTMLHLELPQVRPRLPLAPVCRALSRTRARCCSPQRRAPHCTVCRAAMPLGPRIPPARAPLPPKKVNVLSKMDLVEQYGQLAFGLDFYLQAQGLDHLADAMEGTLPPRFQSMTRELCEVCVCGWGG